MTVLPNGYISFGKNANCTLAVCDVKWSILEYQPSIAGNVAIIALFGLSMIIHLVQGIKWKSWDFMACMAIGCIDEIIGYCGRIMLNKNPFSFPAFVIQTVCITTAPVFFCSAIYVMLSRTITHLDPSMSRFNPRFFIWTFIPCDVLSLILQAAGGGLSAVQAGTSNKTGLRISMAGLILQVITLVIFIALFVDYVYRYHSKFPGALAVTMKVFLTFLLLAILLILGRCAFRIDELSDGYDGPLIHEETLFMVLEGMLMVLAVLSLNFGHPGIAFGVERRQQNTSKTTSMEVITMDGTKSFTR